MKPTQDYILIKPDQAENKTASGLYMQEDWETIPPTGTVLAIGPDVTDIEVGNRVVYLRFTALQFKLGTTSTTEKPDQLVRQRHIVGLLDE